MQASHMGCGSRASKQEEDESKAGDEKSSEASTYRVEGRQPCRPHTYDIGWGSRRSKQADEES